MQFHIQNMSCGGCASSVTKAIQSIDPTAKVTADPVTKKVDVVSDQPRAILESALAEAGYPAGQAIK